MSFTQPIIYHPANDADRKEFIEHLAKIGYEMYGKKGSIIYCFVNIFGVPIYEYDRHKISSDFYDCGSNLHLAKALSALRDDSDYMQWLTDDFHWVLCPDNEASIFAWISLWGNIPRKATAEELIKHFKTEE